MDQIAGIASLIKDWSQMIQVTVFQKKLAGQVGIQIYVVVKPSSDTFLLFSFMNSFSHNFHHFMF